MEHLVTSKVPSRSARRSLPRRQHGVVLFIALIVMVVMTLAALGLIRSVDTTSAVIGNLALRQAAILPANYAVESAAAALFADSNPGGAPAIADITADNAAQNYFSTHSAANDDANGVPLQLQNKAAAQALTLQFPSNCDSSGDALSCDQITYVIERMCVPNAPGETPDKSSQDTWCDMMQPKQSPGTTSDQMNQLVLPKQVFFRVTVRVDGPQNTVSFTQAVLR